MIYAFAILILLNILVTVYFIAVMHERNVRNARDINAIATRLRVLEDKSQALQVAYDFRIKVVENRVFATEDTGFNVETLRGQ